MLQFLSNVENNKFWSQGSELRDVWKQLNQVLHCRAVTQMTPIELHGIVINFNIYGGPHKVCDLSDC